MGRNPPSGDRGGKSWFGVSWASLGALAGLSCTDIVDVGDESEQEEPSFTGGAWVGSGHFGGYKVWFDLGLWVPQA